MSPAPTFAPSFSTGSAILIPGKLVVGGGSDGITVSLFTSTTSSNTSRSVYADALRVALVRAINVSSISIANINITQVRDHAIASSAADAAVDIDTAVPVSATAADNSTLLLTAANKSVEVRFTITVFLWDLQQSNVYSTTPLRAPVTTADNVFETINTRLAASAVQTAMNEELARISRESAISSAVTTTLTLNPTATASLSFSSSISSSSSSPASFSSTTSFTSFVTVDELILYEDNMMLVIYDNPTYAPTNKPNEGWVVLGFSWVEFCGIILLLFVFLIGLIGLCHCLSDKHSKRATRSLRQVHVTHSRQQSYYSSRDSGSVENNSRMGNNTEMAPQGKEEERPDAVADHNSDRQHYQSNVISYLQSKYNFNGRFTPDPDPYSGDELSRSWGQQTE